MLYLGKITSLVHRKARPTCIDEALEKFRAHNKLEELKNRQLSLPAPVNGSLSLPVAKLQRHSNIGDETGPSHPEKHTFMSTLGGTKEEEEPDPQMQNQSLGSSLFKHTDQALKSLANRLDSKLVSCSKLSLFFFKSFAIS